MLNYVLFFYVIFCVFIILMMMIIIRLCRDDKMSCVPPADIITAVSVSVGAAAVGILIYKTLCKKGKCEKPKVNLDVQKDNPKVVHAFDIEDLGDKAVYCRCWRSKKVRNLYE